MKKVNTSLILTVLNEAETIADTMDSIYRQTIKPNEVIVVDGGSKDSTVEILQNYAGQHNSIEIQILIKPGNRSVGRNEAIKNASYPVIAITDAGCILDEKWLELLLKQYDPTAARVVSGYYASRAKTTFQKAVSPYVLVMPDRLSEQDFLPATRSMLVEKNVWERAGGFDERLSDNEDFAFAHAILRLNIPRAFAKEAIAYWIPVKTLPQFYSMIFRFARGDVYAGLFRIKVLLIFARYALATLALLFSPPAFFILFVLYLIWSISKNYRYVKHAWHWLPVLQLTADIAVISGSLAGFKMRTSARHVFPAQFV